MGMVRAATLRLSRRRDVGGGHPLPPGLPAYRCSDDETPPPWPPRLCDRRQPFRQRGIFCYRLFGRRSRSSQFGSELNIAFREVGPLPFSIVLMRLGVRPPLDGQPEEAFLADARRDPHACGKLSL
jgi:hypothetical protein